MTDHFTNPNRFIRECLPKIVGAKTSLDVLIATRGHFLCNETGVDHPAPRLTVTIVAGGYDKSLIVDVPLARSILQPRPGDVPPQSDLALFYISARAVDEGIACVRRYREYGQGRIAVIACTCANGDAYKFGRIADLKRRDIVQYAIRAHICGAQEEMGTIKSALEKLWRERLHQAHAL